MGKKQTQTTRSDVDPRTQGMRNQVYDAATAAANAPPPGLGPMGRGAQDFYGNTLRGGNLGMNALSGDPNAVGQMMNPYQTQVMDNMAQQWGKINNQTTMNINDQATQGGAFGGTRHGVAQGVATANNNAAQAQQAGSLLYGGFNDAMGRAGTLANFGMGGAQATPGFQQWAQTQTDPNMHRMNMLQQGMQGMPYGQQSTNTQKGNAMSTLGGVVSLGAGLLGGPLGGAAAGALGGALGGGGGGGGFPILQSGSRLPFNRGY